MDIKNKNVQKVFDELQNRGLHYDWIQAIQCRENYVEIHIKEKFQVEANLKLHRSQQFIPKRPVKEWANALPFKNDSERNRIQVIQVIHNMMFCVDFSHKMEFQSTHIHTFPADSFDSDWK